MIKVDTEKGHVVNFVFADVNGDLKARFHDPDERGRYVSPFESITDLAELIRGRDFRTWDANASIADVNDLNDGEW